MVPPTLAETMSEDMPTHKRTINPVSMMINIAWSSCVHRDMHRMIALWRSWSTRDDRPSCVDHRRETIINMSVSTMLDTRGSYQTDAKLIPEWFPTDSRLTQMIPDWSHPDLRTIAQWFQHDTIMIPTRVQNCARRSFSLYHDRHGTVFICPSSCTLDDPPVIITIDTWWSSCDDHEQYASRKVFDSTPTSFNSTEFQARPSHPSVSTTPFQPSPASIPRNFKQTRTQTTRAKITRTPATRIATLTHLRTYLRTCLLTYIYT